MLYPNKLPHKRVLTIHRTQPTDNGVKATTFKAKTKDLASKAKAKYLDFKAKDMTTCLQGQGKSWTCKAKYDARIGNAKVEQH